MKNVLTIDIGTTSAKALLVSQEGHVSFTSQEFYTTQFLSQGRAEQDALVILSSVNRMVKECVAHHQREVSSISLSTAMHSILAVDAKCNPLSPLIIWSDMRSADEAKAIRSTPAAANLLKTTGTPVHPMSPLCKLMWLKDHERDLFFHTFKFISIKEFVIWNWTGHWLVDYSVASSSGLFDLQQLQWSDDALEIAGLTSERLSQCVSPYHRVAMRSEISNQFGFEAPVEIVLGASDGCLAHIGCNATQPGDVSLTIGTSGAVRKMSTKISHDPKGRLFNYRLDENSFISGGATNNGTVVVDWFRKNFCQTSGNDLESFVREAARVPPVAEGLLFLPFILGERSPHYNPDLRGVFFGLAQHHTLQHMMRSLLEGICFEMRTLVDALSETVGPVDQILASGGFIRSVEWVQMLANILGREIVVRDINDASSVGAAIIGFRSLGLDYYFGKSDTESRFVPDHTHRKQYDQMYDLFKRAVIGMHSEFDEIASLQKEATFRM